MSAPDGEGPRDIGARSRALGVIAWSAFLAAAVATMVCFALVAPLAIAAGEPPAWWTDRLHVYAVGFFFFWIIGLVAAALCWQLASAPRRDE
jgi:purine-cytosine permease-like protein